MWIDKIDEKAKSQLNNLTNLPFAFKHIAVMPDCHSGYGMPIGTVLATNDIVIPNAVGVDIGCGMCAVKTSLQDIDTETLIKITKYIPVKVPLGYKHHKKAKNWEKIPSPINIPEDGIIKQEWHSLPYQVGTLGGGNHFIEIQKGSDGYIWIMVHSGSRNLGYKVAEYYNIEAQKLNKLWFSGVAEEWQLAFLPVNTPIGRNYLLEMEYCVKFAFANRRAILNQVLDITTKYLKQSIKELQFINIPHNYANLENHFGKNVYVHRKGATRAYNGELGIIPGSQGTKSYIVEGKGNKLSFKSCSHGAGRKMSRTEAQKSLNLQEEISIMNSKNIVHNICSPKHLDEAPNAYKCIDKVMQLQKDLVEIKVELTPIAVVKG